MKEEICNGTPLQLLKEQTEHAKMPFRAIKYDLPWDTYRA
jgi:hypothetical protein